jgi:hypothetical protein
MAFTPTEEAGLKIIFNSFVAAGYSNQVQVEGMLRRLKLEQELRTLQSQATLMAATEDAQNQTYVQAWTLKQAEIQTKQAEIDALAAG